MQTIINLDRPYLENNKIYQNLPQTNNALGLYVVNVDPETNQGKSPWKTSFGTINTNFQVTDPLCFGDEKNPSKDATCICKPPYQKLATIDKYNNFNGFYCKKYLYVN
jgi:hypothetical protein